MGKGRGAADTMEGFAGDGPRSNHMGQDVPVLYGTNPKMPWWTMGDVDSFFMLLFDNLSSLSGIIAAALNAPVFNATPCCQGAIILGIVATALIIPRDLEDRTLYTILAKPVPRLDYLVGKLLGILALTRE